jgi:hypothetical protein
VLSRTLVPRRVRACPGERRCDLRLGHPRWESWRLHECLPAHQNTSMSLARGTYPRGR